MDKLIFPPFEYRFRENDGKKTIFDVIRRKFLVLTPEEWVRQHLIHYLINTLKYPKSLISVEDGMKVNRMNKRSDVIVYNQKGEIFLLVECKSIYIKLTQKSMDQVSMYNQKYKAKFIAITNGLEVYTCKMDYANKKAQFLSKFPDFE